MPRKTIRRFIPDIKSIMDQRSLKWFGSLSLDPNLLHLNRHSVSLAVFIGIFCAFIPLPIQTLLAIAMSFWLGANLPLSMTIIWMSNPVTIPPMFYLTHKLGSYILDTETSGFTIELSWQWFSQLGTDILVPLFLGSLICGATLGMIGYFFILSLWRWRVIKNWEIRKNLRSKSKS